MTRYYPLVVQLHPTPESRSRQHEVLIEIYRQGRIGEALKTFKKLNLETINYLIDHIAKKQIGAR
jgi:hypothetical protein